MQKSFLSIGISLMMLLLMTEHTFALSVMIDPSIRYQTILGLGAFQSAGPVSQEDLFAQDLGASIMRIGIPCQALSPTADLDIEQLNIEKLNWKDAGMLDMIAKVREFNAKKLDTIKIDASVWSPPGWMKNTGGTINGGSLLPNYYAHYGKLLSAFCKGFEERTGVPVYAVSIQNELAFSEWYDSCVYTPEQFRDTVKAVGKQFAHWGIKTIIIGPEDVGTGDLAAVGREMSYINTAEMDADASTFLTEFNVHGYGEDGIHAAGSREVWSALRDQVQPYNKGLWQTETSGQAPSWPAALNIGTSIQQALTCGNVKAWLYWQFFYPQNIPEGLSARLDISEKKYAVAKQLFRYIRPGAVRIFTSGDEGNLFISAFVHDLNHDLTIVMVNNLATDEPVVLNLPKNSGITAMQGWRTSAKESFAVQPDALPRADVITLSLPAMSILTLHGIGKLMIPPAPTITTNVLIKTSSSTATLSWAHTWGADYYQLSRVDGKGKAKVIAKKLTGTSFTDNGLADGQTYTYTVAAVNSKDHRTGPSSTPVTITAQVAFANWAATPPKIDAVNLDPMWAVATSHSLSHTFQGKLTGPDDLAATWKLLWDQHNLYVLIDVTDNALVANLAIPYNGDSVEIYLDGDNSKQSVYSRHDFQYIYPWSASGIAETKHNGVQGVVCAQAKTDTGYRMVICFPLSHLGVAPFAGNTIGFDVMVNDADAQTAGRHVKASWWGIIDSAWMDPSLFGTVILKAPIEQVTAPSAPTTLSAHAEDFFPVLNWQAQPGVLGYVLKRAKSASGPYQAIATIIDAIRYEDRIVPDGQTDYYTLTAFAITGVSKDSAPVSVTPTMPKLVANNLAINCGGGATAYFDADKDVIGGRTYTNYIGTIDRQAAHATAEAVYYTERCDAFVYTIGGLTAGGAYLVRLHFCENYDTQIGQRVFNVKINTQPALTNFDILAETHGAQHTAVVKDCSAHADEQGKLVIDFLGTALCNGIEIIKQ